MDCDFDNLVAMHMAEYDPSRAKELLRVLVELCLDAERRRAARAVIERGTVDRESEGRYNATLRPVSTLPQEVPGEEEEEGASEAGG